MKAKSNWLLTIYILACSLVALAQQPEKIKIVVGDPKTQWSKGKTCHGQPAGYAQTLQRSLRTRLAESGAFIVISRGQLQKLLDEHNLAMSGLSDPVNAKMLGQFLQADLVLSTEVLCHANLAEIGVNLIDVETTKIVWAKSYKMRNLSKINRALDDIVKLIIDHTNTGSTGKPAGDSEKLMMIDSKALRRASTETLKAIERLLAGAEAEIVEVNAYAGIIKLKASGRLWPGLKLKVVRDDEDIGWIFLKESHGDIITAGTLDEISAFEEGDRASSESFVPNVAIGVIEDLDEENHQLLEMFREDLMQQMRISNYLRPIEDRRINRLLLESGKRLSQKTLAELFTTGVDLIVIGSFMGESGHRSLDFDVIAAQDGRQVTKIKYRSNL